jgi:hypothetical protein
MGTFLQQTDESKTTTLQPLIVGGGQFEEVVDWLGRPQNDGRSFGAARCLRGCPMT